MRISAPRACVPRHGPCGAGTIVEDRTPLMPSRVTALALVIVLTAVCGCIGVVRAQTSVPAVAPPILLSRQLIARAHVSIGDVVTLATDASGRSAKRFTVVGVYEPTPDPMRFT